MASEAKRCRTPHTAKLQSSRLHNDTALEATANYCKASHFI